MKFSVALCVLALVALSSSKPNRGCQYILGRCYKQCDEGTHAYTTGCGYLTPEATCDNPHPVEDTARGQICDYSTCRCDDPTVRDPVSRKCVKLEECPKKEE